MAAKLLLSVAKGSVILCLALLTASTVVSQSSAPRSSKHSRSVRNSRPAKPAVRDIFLLQLQMAALRQVFLKYDDYESPRLVWCNDQIWWDMLKIRGDLDVLLKNASAVDRNGTWSTQYEMEDTVLTLLASNHLDFLVSELELSNDQINGIEKVLHSDVSKKHQTLRMMWPNFDPEYLFRRLDEITNETDFFIRKVLFDEQLKDYQRIKSDAFRSQTRHLASFKSLNKSRSFSPKL